MSTTNTQEREPDPSKNNKNNNTGFNLAKSTIAHLHSTNQTLATAESLTAGQLTATLASVPGASTVVRGGVVAYATPLKHTLLGVEGELLEREGAVDPAVVVAMARGARAVTRVPSRSGSGSGGTGGDGGGADAARTAVCDESGAAYGGEEGKGESERERERERERDRDDGITDWGIATTGVAGPDPQDGKPAGTVYIGVASAAGARAWGPFMFRGGREKVREAAVTEALVRLREAVIGAPTADTNGGKEGDDKRGQ